MQAVLQHHLSEVEEHEHVFLGKDHEKNERRTWFVVALTSAMMIAEIIAGTLFGSMALLADGWHMSTHAAALAIAAVAYRLARKHAHNPRFSFGTGKLGELAGFSSALILAMIALFIGYESVLRLIDPVPIQFDEAILVACIGLGVNLVSAWLLAGDHHHHHGHEDDHGHHDHHGHRQHGHEHDEHDHHAHGHDKHAGHDTNLRAAYMHVLADALTSVLAIIALLAGRFYGWNWLDPVMGIVGALVISRWSWGLIRSAGSVLLDVVPSQNVAAAIRKRLEVFGDHVADLHLWRLGPGHVGVIASVVSDRPQPPEAYKARLRGIDNLSHITVEVHSSADPAQLPHAEWREAEPEVVGEIEHAAEHVPGIIKVLEAKAHRLGDSLRAEVELGVDPDLPVSVADKIVSSFHHELMEHLPGLHAAHIRARAV
jgi:cation diffusion facilitator family transporter